MVNTEDGSSWKVVPLKELASIPIHNKEARKHVKAYVRNRFISFRSISFEILEKVYQEFVSDESFFEQVTVYCYTPPHATHATTVFYDTEGDDEKKILVGEFNQAVENGNSEEVLQIEVKRHPYDEESFVVRHDAVQVKHKRDITMEDFFNIYVAKAVSQPSGVSRPFALFTDFLKVNFGSDYTKILGKELEGCYIVYSKENTFDEVFRAVQKFEEVHHIGYYCIDIFHSAPERFYKKDHGTNSERQNWQNKFVQVYDMKRSALAIQTFKFHLVILEKLIEPLILRNLFAVHDLYFSLTSRKSTVYMVCNERRLKTNLISYSNFELGQQNLEFGTRVIFDCISGMDVTHLKCKSLEDKAMLVSVLSRPDEPFGKVQKTLNNCFREWFKQRYEVRAKEFKDISQDFSNIHPDDQLQLCQESLGYAKVLSLLELKQCKQACLNVVEMVESRRASVDSDGFENRLVETSCNAKLLYSGYLVSHENRTNSAKKSLMSCFKLINDCDDSDLGKMIEIRIAMKFSVIHLKLNEPNKAFKSLMLVLNSLEKKPSNGNEALARVQLWLQLTRLLLQPATLPSANSMTAAQTLKKCQSCFQTFLRLSGAVSSYHVIELLELAYNVTSPVDAGKSHGILTKLIRAIELHIGKRNLQLYQALMELGQLEFSRMKSFQDALSTFERAREVAIGLLGNESIEYFRSWALYADVLLELNNPKQAASEYRIIRDRAGKSMARDSEFITSVKNKLKDLEFNV